MIILPAAWLMELSSDVLEAVIAHELSHIRRWDLWVNLFQRFVETLFFYHPAVWWVSRQIRLEREKCCDELAVTVTGNRVVYATTLEFLARKRLAVVQAALAAGMGGSKMALLNRVRYILGSKTTEQPVGWWQAGMFALAVPIVIWLATENLEYKQASATELAEEQTAIQIEIKPLHQLEHKGVVYAVTWSPDGKHWPAARTKSISGPGMEDG